ncbi:MAG: carboxylating nicotinate-nucleotide diphosphorylase [Crenarchaeota archaeon]|nr:carboxylating nicotinate-nucleotide diphosphorylase [Thermoproteota archaeon]
MFIPRRIIEERLREFLVEDLGEGDVTASAIIAHDLKVKAEIVAKQEGIVAGIEESIILAELVGLEVEAKVVDGDKVEKQQTLMVIFGNAQTILSVERTLLNLLSRMSGIATKTHTLSQQLLKAKVKARVAATRKSAPGLLYFDKKAVAIGGGDPHRLHLDDMVLIKDNHLAILGDTEEAVKKAKTNTSFTKKIEIEVTDIQNALKAARAGADIVMLDNFAPKEAMEAGEQLRKAGFNHVILEVSGGVTSENILEYASAQVDIISIGELTHSIRALDISLEVSRS